VIAILEALVGALLTAFRSRASLGVENLALRQQLAVLRRRRRRLDLRAIDGAFWVTLSRVWLRWADSLVIVKPATLIVCIDAASPGSGLGSRAPWDDPRWRPTWWL
jgi:hypothetical protein